jgi:excisionase family DNA binding protein
MARPEVTGRKHPETDADAYSIAEFCERHRISHQLFYKLRAQGQMPATFNVGSRVLISKEAAAAWRRARENAAQAMAESVA